MAKRIWTGEAAKVRRKTLTAIDRRCTKKVGESTLGAHFSAAKAKSACAKQDQISLYAAAMGISGEEAAAKVSAQESRLAQLGDPWGF